MRRISIAAAIVIGILILALGSIWALANPNRHRDLIQGQLESRLGRKVSLGEMTLGLIPLRFQVDNPAIAEDPDFGGAEPFVRAERLDIQIPLFPLLRGNLEISSIVLRRPSVEFIRTRQGVWNFSTIGSKAAGQSTTSEGSSGGGLSLDRLTIVDGQIGITDLTQAHSRTAYDHIDLTILDYAPEKPFTFDLAAHIQGQGTQEVRLKGEAGPIPQGNPSETPFHGRLNFNAVAIDGFLKFLDAKAVSQAAGILSGESEIASQSGNITTSGKLKIENAQLNRLNIGYPILFDFKGGARMSDGLVTIDTGTLQLGQTPLSVSGSVATSATPVTVNLRIRSGDVSIAEIGRLASAFGVVFAPGTNVAGRVNADVQARGPATQPALTGTIAGHDLRFSGGGIPQPVEVKAISLALSPSEIRSNEFNASSGQTTVAARFAMLQYASKSPSVDVQLRSAAATLPEIQSIAKAYGVTGLDQISGAGTLNFDLNAKGPLQSLTTQSATRALNGIINLDFSPLKVLGFDTAHELGKIGGFASSLADQSATDIIKMTGRILVKDGVAQTSDLIAKLAVGSLAAAGTADLTTEALNLKLSAVFSKAFTDKVGNSRAGSFLDTALTNSSGELVLPAIVTGTFTKPTFAPDLKAVAQLQKQKFVPTLDNPAAAITNVLGILKGKNDSNKNDSNKQEQPEKPSGLKGLLDIFGKKKPPSQ